MPYAAPTSPVFSTQLAPFTISFAQSEEFHQLKREIFSQHVYYFETNAPRPRIIDAGAHIGLSTLYFKKLFPTSMITAVEPLPQNVALLEQNTWQNRLSDVKIVPAALWPVRGEVELHFDQTSYHWLSTASTLPKAWNGQQDTTSVKVPTVPLSSLLTQPTDFLKLDIEGAEQAVLEEARQQLNLVKEMIIEFHPVSHQSLAKLVQLLKDKNFEVHVWKDGQEVPIERTRGLVYIQAKQRR